MPGALTHTEALDWSELSFVVDTEPVLFTTPVVGQLPPVAPVVGEVMWTVYVLAPCDVPAGTVTGPQMRVPALLIAHGLALPLKPAPWPAIVQERPGFVGSGSLIVTPFASPMPVLKTVRVKPIGSPALTCA